MTQVLKCPSCGAPLDYIPGQGLTIRCAYCDSTILPPEELRGGFPHLTPDAAFPGVPLGQMMRLKEVAEALRRGNKIEAIKIYREIFGVSLKEAKDAVEAMAAGQPVVMAKSNRQVQVSSFEIHSGSATPPRRQGGSAGCFVFALTLILLLGGGALLFTTPLGAQLGLSPVSVEDITSSLPNPVAAIQPTPSPTPGLATLALSFGQEGLNPGQFADARHVAVDGAGVIYVAEWKEGSRVQRFDQNGNFLSQWPAADAKAIVTGLAADQQGIVYVIQGSTLSRYAGETGELLGPVSYQEETNGFEAVTAIPGGGVVALWNQEAVRLDAQGNAAQTIPEVVTGQTGERELDPHLAVDGQGNLYVLGSFAEAVFKYGPDGRFINRFGSSGSEPGQFSSVQAIAVDGQGQVYIGDSSGILVFSPDGRYIDMIKTEGVPFGLTFNAQDDLLVASRTQILKYTLNDNKIK